MKWRLIILKRLPVDPEEMLLRQDEDFIASLKMVGEGAPSFNSFINDEDEESSNEDRELPRAYQ